MSIIDWLLAPIEGPVAILGGGPEITQPTVHSGKLMTLPTWSSFATFAGAFTIYSLIMVGAADGRYGEIVVALAWLVAIGATAYWWQLLGPGLAPLIPAAQGWFGS